jgi:hypothetical protein
MAWIESHQGLAKHPKTKKLIRRLNTTGPIIVGHLHYFWWWALDFAQDGEITQYDVFDIADACEWQGNAEELFSALIDSGFIDKTNDRYFIHDWHDYAGKLIEIRKKDAERKRKSRGKKEESEGNPPDIQWTSEGRRSESIRDLDLNQDLKETTTNAQAYETVGDIHTKVFKTFSMTGIMSDYIMGLKKKGYQDSFITELMLETGESGTNPSLRLMQTIGERWIKDGIYTRAESKRRHDESKQKGFSQLPNQAPKEHTPDLEILEEMRELERLRKAN